MVILHLDTNIFAVSAPVRRKTTKANLLFDMSFFGFVFARQNGAGGAESFSDYLSEIVTRYPAALGVVATNVRYWCLVSAT